MPLQAKVPPLWSRALSWRAYLLTKLHVPGDVSTLPLHGSTWYATVCHGMSPAQVAHLRQQGVI